MATEKLMIRNIPPKLKGKIASRAERDGTNMKDVMVGILASHYDVEFRPSGVKRLGIGPSPQVCLDVPPALKIAIDDEAHARRDSMTNVALEIISAEFRVPFTPTGRWAGKAAAAT